MRAQNPNDAVDAWTQLHPRRIGDKVFLVAKRRDGKQFTIGVDVRASVDLVIDVMAALWQADPEVARSVLAHLEEMPPGDPE